MSARVWAALAVVAVLGVAGCSSTQTAKRVPPGGSLTATPAPLATAIKQAAKLGPAGMSTHVDLSLGLKVRNGEELARLMASGRTVTPAEYSSRFGPDPIKVQAALEILTARLRDDVDVFRTAHVTVGGDCDCTDHEEVDLVLAQDPK